MENLNNVPSSGTYGGAINEVNHNFSLVKGAIDGLEGRTIRSKGLFPTVAALNAAYPSPIVGDYAYVGSGLPAEIYDCVTAGTWHDTGQTGGSETINLGDYSTTTQMNAAIDSGLQGQVGYAVCSTAGATKRKDVVVSGFKLLANGGALHIKMTTANTNASATMNISPTSTVIAANTKPLFYNGEQATAENTWDANEILSIYYDGTNYQATNSQGGGGKAEKIKYNNSQSGLEATDAQGAIDEIANKMPILYSTEGDNTNGAMTQAAISEMTEFRTLRRTTTFATSGTNQEWNPITDLAAGSYIVEVDTPVTENNAKLSTLRFRNGSKNVRDISNIPLDGNTYTYRTTFSQKITRVYLWAFNPTGSYGQIVVRIYSSTGFYSRLDSIPYDVSAYNNKAQYTLSTAVVAIPSEKRQVGMQLKFIGNDGNYHLYQYKGTVLDYIEDISYWQLMECTQNDIPYNVSAYNNNTIYTLTSAIENIPANVQQVGMMVKFINPNKRYSIYKYIGNTLANIANKSYWEQVVGSEEELKGDLTVKLSGNYTMTSYGINADENSADFGTAVSQSSGVWATPHIKCRGYDYLYVTLYPSSNTTYYKYGCVFYDENQDPIHGYGSMAYQASSTNDGNPVYNFPRCLEIPSNAVTFRTTYRNNQYPTIKLITGKWDKIPTGARYTYTYYGEKIEMKKSHKVYLTHYGKYQSDLSSNQAGCAYGNYLFLFGQQNFFSIVEFADPAGSIKTPIQSNIAIPNMRTSDGNSVIHNDGVGFTDVFYDANDDFPMIVCGGGYAENATGTTYFYVVRIVKNDDGNGTITFTPTVIQEITVISGITTGTSGSCLNVFYDTDRHVIIASGKGYTWVTKYNVSKTEGDFTIDLRDPSSYTQLFYKQAGSGSYYNGHLFAANEYNNKTQILFKSLNVITGEYTSIVLGRHYEPEAVFAWNDELYLLEVGNLFKLYFD